MDPFVEKKFRNIYQSNPELFENKDYASIQREFNKLGGTQINNVNYIPNYVTSISFEEPFAQKETKKKSTYQPTRAEFVDAVLSGGTESPFQLEEEPSSWDSLYKGNEGFIDNILDFIGGLESSNRSNAYSGDFNSDEVYDFQNMTLRGVLDWQEKNANKAVGRFQYKPETLKRIAKAAGIDLDEKFTDEIQKKLGIQSLRDRGLDDFLKDPSKNKDNFSLNLTKEWASLPLPFDYEGKKRGQSYYQNTTSNISLATVDEFAKIIDLQTWNAKKATQKERDRNHREVLEYAEKDELFGDINTSYLEKMQSGFLGSTERDLKVDLTKRYGYLGFEFLESQAGKDYIQIQAPNKTLSEPIRVEPTLTDSLGDAAKSLSSLSTGLKVTMPSVFGALKKSDVVEKTSNTEKELGDAAYYIRSFLKNNYIDVSKKYINNFNQDPFGTALRIYKNGVTVSQNQIDGITLELDQLNRKLDQTVRYDYVTGPAGYAVPVETKEYAALRKEIEEKKFIINTRDRQKRQVSKDISRLIDNSGGIDRWVKDENYGEAMFKDFISSGLLLPEDLILPSVKIQGRHVSLDYAKSILDDFAMRNAYHDGDLDIEVNTDFTEFGPGLVTDVTKAMTNDFLKYWDKQTHDGSVKERIDYAIKSIGNPLLASGLDVVINTASALSDLSNIPQRVAMKYMLEREGMEKEDASRAIESLYNNHYDPLFKKARAEVRKIREEQVVTSGGITDVSSFYEFFTKGGVAAAESLPITTLFILAPEVGLATAGLSVYGESMNQYMEYSDLAKQYRDQTGYVPLELQGYENLTVERARALSLAKGAGEAAITSLFTYNYIKGLTKATRGAAVAEGKELLDLVKSYRSSFLSRFSGSLKAAGYEVPEESLISIENMYVDDVSGVTNYEFSDYVKQVKETAVASLFTSIPLGLQGMSKKTKHANDYILNLVSDRIMSKEERSLYDERTKLDNTIQEMEERKEVPSPELLAKRQEISLAILQNKADKLLTTSLADNKTVRQIAESEIKINMLTSDYKNAKNDVERDIIKKKLTDEVKKSDELSYRVNENSFLERSQEATEILRSKYVQMSDQEEEMEEFVVLEPITVFDKKMRQGAINLGLMRDSYAFGDLGFNKNDNIFTRHGEKVDEMISFLNSINDGNLEEDQIRSIESFLGALHPDENGNFNPENSGFLKAYYSLVGANRTLSEIESGRPAELTSKKINPFSFIESLFMGKNLGIASIEQIIRSAFKNQRMQMPLLTLHNQIDVGVKQAEREVQVFKDQWNNLLFLGEKISDKRKEKFVSLESQIERGFLAHLGKWIDSGKKGRAALEARDSQFKQKVIALENYITKLSKDKSNRGQEVFNAYKNVYEKIVNGSITYADMEAKADSDNVQGMNFMRNMFDLIKNQVFNHMKDYVGNEPTNWNRYAPTFFSNVNGSNSIADAYTSDFDYVRDSGVPPTLRTSGEQLEISGDLFFENYDRLAFKVYENTLAHMNSAPLMSQYDGVINSKRFKNLFDTDRSKRYGSKSNETDFDFMKSLLLSKTDRLRKKLNNIGNQTQVSRSSSQGLRDFMNTITKVATTKRLASVDMRIKQAYSAMFAQLPNLGSKARSFLLSKTLNFTTFRGADDLNNQLYKAVLDKSVTASRGGLSQFSQGYLDKVLLEEARTKSGKIFEGISKGVNSGADFLLENLLANPDRLAGKMTFLSFYMDYEMRNNPAVQDMNDKEFWTYASENINTKAIAYADTQVSISQTQSTPWNLGGVFGVNSSEGRKMLAQVAFLFGRFAYNRKVGIANDISVLYDEFSTDSDKANARRRLMSAGIEIGVFKALTPTFSVIFTQLMTPLISSLLGFDDELDEAAGTISDFYGDFTGKEVTKNQLQLYNYQRNLTKEFFTSMTEGMMPTPLPGVANDLIFAGINSALKSRGIIEEDLFNIYNPAMRNLSTDYGPINENDIAQFMLSNAGVAEIVTEDLMALINNPLYFIDGRVPKFSTLGRDRYVVDRAKKAADVLHTTELLNLFFPSADLARFNRSLRGVIMRKYLKTNPDETQETQKVPKQIQGTRSIDELMQRIKTDEMINN